MENNNENNNNIETDVKPENNDNIETDVKPKRSFAKYSKSEAVKRAKAKYYQKKKRFKFFYFKNNLNFLKYSFKYKF